MLQDVTMTLIIIQYCNDCSVSSLIPLSRQQPESQSELYEEYDGKTDASLAVNRQHTSFDVGQLD